MEGIPDKKLLAIGRAIGNNEKLSPLALELNFTYAEFENFKAINHSGGGVISDGTISMLFTWREKTRRDDQARALFHALEQAELVEVAEEHLPEGGADSTFSSSMEGFVDEAGKVYQNRLRELARFLSRDPDAFFKFCDEVLGIKKEKAQKILDSNTSGNGIDFEKSYYDALTIKK